MRNGTSLASSLLSDDARSDPIVVSAAVETAPHQLRHVPDKLKTPSVCATAFARSSAIFPLLPEREQTPVRAALFAYENPDKTQSLPDEFCTKKIYMGALGRVPLRHMPVELQTDPDILEVTAAFGGMDAFFDVSLRGVGLNTMLRLAKSNGLVLQFDGPQDVDVCRAALCQSAEALPFVKHKLMSDPALFSLIRFRVAGDGTRLKSLPLDMRQNKGLVECAVAGSPTALQYAADELKHDEDIVLGAVKIHPEAIFYAGDQLRRSAQFMLRACRVNGMAYTGSLGDAAHSEIVRDAALAENFSGVLPLMPAFYQLEAVGNAAMGNASAKLQ